MFPAFSSMTVFEVLSEVVCTKEFLRLIAFTELVVYQEMLSPLFPVLCRIIREFITAISANVVRGYTIDRLRRRLL